MNIDNQSIYFFIVWFGFFTYETYMKYCNNNKKKNIIY